MKVAFITTFCPHHRQKTFETLARYYSTVFYFFSAGDEWYWQRAHGVQQGAFEAEYLWGTRIKGTRFTPTLPFKLWRGNYDVYVKCINGRFALPISYLVARLRGKPFVLWTGIWMRLQSRAHRWFFPITRFFYRHADAVVVYGEHVKRYLISEGVDPERIFVAAHAVDNPSYNQPVAPKELTALRQTLDLAPEQKVILYLGRLEESKGINDLLNAFATLDQADAVLVLAGAGRSEEQIRAHIAARGLQDRVRLPGYVPTDQTVAYYALAEVLVLPSITLPSGKEPWGLVVNEAFNQGVPVIATDAVGAAMGGLIQDGLNGFIVAERDSAGLAQALKRVLGDSALRQRLALEARSTIAGWDNEHMVHGFRDAISFATRHSRPRAKQAEQP